MKLCCLKCLEHLKLFSCSSISHRETMERGSCVMMLSHLPCFLKQISSLLVRIEFLSIHTQTPSPFIVSEPSPVFIDANDLRVQTLNILWGSFSQSMYTLTITNTHNQPQILKLNQSYYGFTAPEGAPPCEIYNFSVTAIYVGASYTGAGCSVPSPVLSRMLPSLPNITKLESSLGNYSLEKDSTGVVTLTVFMVRCMFVFMMEGRARHNLSNSYEVMLGFVGIYSE